MRLIIVRHGETTANLERTLQGHSQNPLSERGRTQARHLGERLLGEGIERMYSSDLCRAIETAEIIAESIDLPIELTPALKERSYGNFEGQAYDIYDSAVDQSGLARHLFCPENGENLEQVEARLSEFIDHILVAHPEETVLLVAHAGANRLLIKCLLKKSFDGWVPFDQDNACINIFDIAAPREVQPILVNCTNHLDSVGFQSWKAYE